jgi:hypothetical protein
MNSDLIKFIEYSISQKEISLIITKDEKEIQRVVKTLMELGYHQAINVSDMIKIVSQPSKIFITLEDDFSKDIYDFIVQYPTGQVEIYDKVKLKSQTVTPVYKDASIVVVVDEETIKKTKFPILEKVGLTYRGNL